ncbi:MAG: YkgJ family cysteine cluster protein [Myxococcota bacterium]|nr:YkgJ family cysteine cluster protein [Myxococcota bacterium]
MTDSEQKYSELPEPLKGRRQLSKNDTFCFDCQPGISCFTQCCADINILLTPLDVLRLARRLDMSTREFLDTHTMMPITKDLHLPVVMLKMSDAEDKRCSFVDKNGCGVYEDRPWSCRMYPLGMGLPPARAGEDPVPVYVLFEDDFCKGTKEKNEWTVDSWKQNQAVPEREAFEVGFQEIVSHPWFIGGRQLDPRRIEMFHMACYDLDTFRRFVFSSTFLNRFELEEDLIEEMRTSDEALLQFAFRWLRFALFAEPTMKVRETAQKPGRNP